MDHEGADEARAALNALVRERDETNRVLLHREAQMQAHFQRLEQERNSLDAALDKALTERDAARAESARLAAEVDALRREAEEAARDGCEAEKTAIQSDLKAERLAAEVERLREILRSAWIAAREDGALAPAPQQEAAGKACLNSDCGRRPVYVCGYCDECCSVEAHRPARKEGG